MGLCSELFWGWVLLIDMEKSVGGCQNILHKQACVCSYRFPCLLMMHCKGIMPGHLVHQFLNWE